MTAFIAVAALLVALAAAFVLPPLLRGGAGTPARKGSEVERFGRERKRLDAEHKAGRLSEAAHAQACAALEKKLVAALADEAPEEATAGATARPPRAIATAAVVVAVLVAVPAVLYVLRGTPDAFRPEVANAKAEAEGGEGGGARQISPAQVEKMIEQLQAGLQKNPDDIPSWVLLARANAYLQHFPESVRAFTQAIARNPKDANLLADLADVMAAGNGRKIDGDVMKVVNRSLQLDPRQAKALALAGTYYFDQGQYAKAADFWEKSVASAEAGNEKEFADTLRKDLAEARRLAGGGTAAPLPPMLARDASSPSTPASASPSALPSQGASVHGRAQLSPALAGKARPEDTVFVIARAAQGPRIPLALLRRQVRDLPFDFTLDESMAMTPDFTLAKYPQVTVTVRVSHSGDAMPAAGDLEGSSGTVSVGPNARAVVTIDHAIAGK